MSSYKTTFLGQNQGALQSPCNLTTLERIVATVGICLNSYSWCNFWCTLWCNLCPRCSSCTWYNLGTPPETRGSSQTVNSLSFAAALILTQGTKRTLTGPHFSEISSVLFEAQLSADSWLWKKKFTTRSIWLMKGEKVTKVATMISQRKKVLQEMRARSKNWTSTCSIFSFYQFANSRSRTRLWEKRQISCAVIASRSIEQILLNYILHQSLGPCIFPLPKTSWAIKVSLSLGMTHIYGSIFGLL